MKYITYGELFFRSTGKISYKDIRDSVPKVRKRMRIALLSIVTTLVLIAAVSYLLRYYTPYASLFFLIAVSSIACTVSPIFRYLDKINLNDLLREYGKLYNLSEKEKTDISALIDRVKRERINGFLVDSIHNEEYLKNLMENAKDRRERSKKDFKLNELGIVAVVLIVLNSFFTHLYNSWKTDGFLDILGKTITILIIIVAVGLSYYLGKDVHLHRRNTAYRQHNQLYGILRDLETRAKFNKQKSPL